MSWRLSLSQLPLRLRLTAWYLLTLGLILFLSGSTIYWQTERSLRAQIDSALQLVAVQAAANVDTEGGHLAFDNAEDLGGLSAQLSGDTVIFLLSPDGEVWGWLGRNSTMRPFPISPGAYTARYAGDEWRIYGKPLEGTGGAVSGWLQVAQSLKPTAELLSALLLQLLWGIPMALLLAGVGGYFMASRALAPIERITRTGEAISTSDLSRRIGYSGPADEVGRLAATFDRMLDRLQAGFERERRFTGDAAHELRTPLAALKGRIGVTLSQPRQPGEYVETLQEMEQQVDRLVRLSSDLLYIARLEQGRLKLDYESVGLADLLSAVVDQLQPQAGSKNITIVETVPPGLEIRGDFDMLVRLFLNLLDNAVKYTPAGGRVALHAGQSKSGVTIIVSDTGPGIPAEHLPHLFERFYRAESARSRDGNDNGRGGAGLGLAIAHEIVNAHGGSLAVQSSPEQGTTFTVHFPHTS
ncbi:MAG: HAMP domain-containing protein [Caldilineaceae bacterium]|nr:HAMP domain-containing protein [Caldilineaceae bacterium]